jgi:hypothetical protein
MIKKVFFSFGAAAIISVAAVNVRLNATGASDSSLKLANIKALSSENPGDKSEGYYVMHIKCCNSMGMETGKHSATCYQNNGSGPKNYHNHSCSDCNSN